MPENTPSQPDTAQDACASAMPPCAQSGTPGGFDKCMSHCMNCRRDVENSMSRIGGRKLRKLRSMEECSVGRCTAFLRTVQDDAMRLHLASMAWWRFSAVNEGVAESVRRIITACKSREPGSGQDYMHRALRVLSPLSQAQLSVWFGCENLYQAASLFVGNKPALLGAHCQACRLYKLGCTEYDRMGADDCPLWNDPFVQGVAATIKKDGGTWRDPCRGLDDNGKGKP